MVRARFTAACRLAAALSLIVPATPSPGGQPPAGQAPLRPPDVIFVPTPPEVVAAMLRVARVGKGDVIYDLGSGDGRIVISAVKDFGAARGVGIDIDPERIADASANARQAGVADRVTFLNQDLFTTNFSDATVVTLYLLPSLNLKLRPKLLSDLRPGTRIVSHAFDIGDWVPEQTIDVGGRRVYFWTVPAR
jgi:SAM-dependent methyltransferase